MPKNSIVFLHPDPDDWTESGFKLYHNKTKIPGVSILDSYVFIHITHIYTYSMKTFPYGSDSRKSWYLYEMVTQNMLRTCEGNHDFSKITFEFATDSI